MAITVLSNLPAMNARRHLEETSQVYAQASERLASGKRINRASDDAAGLAISFSLEAKIRSISQARRNASDALSLMQVAEGGMNEVGNLIVRMRELSIQASSDTIGERERTMLELESNQIKSEVERLANATSYFGTNLLNGSGKEFTFQIGPDNTEHNRINYATSKLDLRASTLGIDDVNLSSADRAVDSLGAIDEALSKMNTPRAEVGAMGSRFHSIISNLAVYEENLTAAKSRIMDADIAQEAALAVQGSVLQKAGTAVLAQANMAPAMALKLLD